MNSEKPRYKEIFILKHILEAFEIPNEIENIFDGWYMYLPEGWVAAQSPFTLGNELNLLELWHGDREDAVGCLDAGQALTFLRQLGVIDI